MEYIKLQELNRTAWKFAIKAFKLNKKGRYQPYSNKRIRDFSSCVGKTNMIALVKLIISSFTPPLEEIWRKNTEFEDNLLLLMEKKSKKDKWLNLFFRYLLWNTSLIEIALKSRQNNLIIRALQKEKINDSEILSLLNKIGIKEAK